MKRFILAAAFAASVTPAFADDVILPPKEYDYPFDGRLIVEVLPYWDVMKACGRVEYYHGGRIEACSRHFSDPQNFGKFACKIIYPHLGHDGVEPDYFLKLIRHETAHCNGWPGYHPDGHFED